MAKRKTRSKRSTAALPKGLPQKRQHGNIANPFEYSASHKRPKQQVHNRFISTQAAIRPSSTNVPPLKRRSQHLLQQSLQQAQKANVFVDHRIGEYNRHMSVEEQNLARLVKERSRRSKRSTKFSLQDTDNSGQLTHHGQLIDDRVAMQNILLSDDEDDEDRGQLDALDTALHFGGGTSDTQKGASAYGPTGDAPSIAQAYSQRKTELNDLILRRKTMKLERVKAREQQEDVVATLDGSFAELSRMLQFRDKEQEIRQHIQHKREGTLPEDAKEMEAWEQEIREYSAMGRRAKATDRTKSPEEIAKEEAERLHQLETRRLARMNGDFSGDEFSDVSDDDTDNKQTKKKKYNKKKAMSSSNPEALDNSDDEEESKLTAKFTSEGLVYVNKAGEVVKRVGDSDEEKSDGGGDETEEANADKDGGSCRSVVLTVGTLVQGNYHAREQYEDKEHWYDGVISKVTVDTDGNVSYNVDYDDGDFEEDMDAENVRLLGKSNEEKQIEAYKKDEDLVLKRKRQKAKEKARSEIPFVFEIPTTLDALHDMIGHHASTGQDASLIIQRIHSANSVKLDRRNAEKMQNFYDVLLRRFVAVGDAIYNSGDGGPELGRYQQLSTLTETLYKMTQDSPDAAAAVWSRRIGILMNSHSKRLRDSEFQRSDGEDNDNDDGSEGSAWPSLGVLLLLRSVGHLFPVTDRRHHIVTPVVLFLGQILAQTPVSSMYDLVMGAICSGLLLEFTLETKRIAPEALGFLAGILRLSSSDPSERLNARYPVPTLEAAAQHPAFSKFRQDASKCKANPPLMCPEKSEIALEKYTAAAILFSALDLIESSCSKLTGGVGQAEKELFAELTGGLLRLNPRSKTAPLSEPLRKKVASTACALSNACKLDHRRVPLMRRQGPTVQEKALKSLAPRLEDPERYSYSKDKGKNPTQVAIDRTRREYKREHKAVARELRLDAAFIEKERRKEEEKKTSTARAARQKNFAWLESEQAAMNQQVRLGGGLLKGGGMGAAKSKAKSGKLGMKKGGKF